jgi:Glutaredoxin
VRDRCGVHGIALADDGTCVLCRRTSRPTTAELYGGSADPGGPRGIWVGLVVVLAAASVLAAIMVVVPGSLKTLGVAPEPPARAGAVPPSPAVAAAPSAAAVRAPGRASAEGQGEATADRAAPPPAAAPSFRWVTEPMNDEAVRAVDPAAAAREAERAQALDRQQAEFEAWAHREANRDIEEQEARRARTEVAPAAVADKQASADALRRVPITLYGAPWCGACNATKGAQIPFTERDVDTDAFAAAEARRLNPRGSIPVIDVAGRILVGFRPATLIAAIQDAARR